MDRDFFSAFGFVTCIKFLFIPLYHSTDMEVHRNWKAITHSLSYKQWYYEDASPWTLDYPPFFAWFEYILSFFALFFDQKMLNVRNLNYESRETVIFMRTSVVLSDLLYAFAIGKLYNLIKRKREFSSDPWIKPNIIFAMLMLWNPGLLLVDHIHFQYNGFLNGFLFLSIAAIMQDKYIEAALWYSVLLNFKHLYVYFAPAYFVYLLKNYCFLQRRFKGSITWKSFSVKRFLSLGAVVSGIFLLSFGPFIAAGQQWQVLKRIFPVKRGLTHAYWAPNFWALYNFMDRMLVIVMRLVFGSKYHTPSSATKGLVQQYNHVILPSVNVEVTVLLTALSVMPFMWLIWKKPKSWLVFVHTIVGCAFGSFIFGYHVHEKAVLMIILPLTILAVCQQEFTSIFILLSTVGNFSLFPLLFKTGETPIKIVLLILFAVYAYTGLRQLHRQSNVECEKSFLHTNEKVLLVGIALLQILNSFGFAMLKLDVKFPFLPLMVTSVYCAICVLYSYVKYCQLLFQTKT